MRPECISAVNAAAGRKLSDEHIARIEAAVRDAGVRLAQADRERWAGLSREQRTAEVGAQAVKDLQDAATLKQQRALEHLLAQAESSSKTVGASSPSKSKTRTFEDIVDERARQIAIERPDMIVGLDEDGHRITAAEVFKQSEREFADSRAEAELAQVASECFVRTGYVPAAAMGFRGAGRAGQSAVGKIGEKALDVASVVLNIL